MTRRLGSKRELQTEALPPNPRPLPADLRPVPRLPTDARVSVVADGLWCLRLPLPYAAPTFVNCYLVAADDGYVLVDCGTSLEPGWAALEHALGLAGVAAGSLRLLVCTHMHSDHAGLAAEVVGRTGCEYARGIGVHAVNDALRDPIVPLEVRRHSGLREGIPPSELDDWVDANLADDGRHARIPPDTLLADGDVLESRLGRWSVVATPGHSATQLALFNARRRWLIAADLAYVTGLPFIEYGYSADPYADHLASLDRSRALGPTLLLPGHGRPSEAADHTLATARGATVAASGRVRRALSRGAHTGHQLALELAGEGADTDGRQSTLAVTLCMLEHLLARGEVASETGADGVRRFGLASHAG